MRCFRYGGYIFGKIFKGPKLTKISPNKTYSGAFGSVVLSLVFAYVLLIFLGLNFNYLTFLTVILTSIYCQIGDLLFSFLKRKAKLQDTGKILPGHGGILDRIDGIIIGIPLGLITFDTILDEEISFNFRFDRLNWFTFTKYNK